MMDRNEIIRRLEKIAGHAVHTAGEPPLVLGLDDGTALYDAATFLKEQEPKAGHWTVLKNCSNSGVYCSECQTKVFDHYPMPKKLSRFCPHCGAKMEKPEEAESDVK